jgi:glutamate synthase (NADPH/NADH) small chain
MGDPKGFLKVQRSKEKERAVVERVRDFHEFTVTPTQEEVKAQASRCMDCGIPFCHKGCPLGNLIPEFNDLVYRGRMEEAAASLLSTNNFPEVTGRVCPAPCEASCVLNIENTPVTIKGVEKTIAEYIGASGAYAPQPPARKTGKRVAVVGSGPAGLAAAQQLARLGHDVTVFEKDDRLGGLLRYGIPDFKMEKEIIDRRVEQMKAEGVVFRTSVRIGVDVQAADLRRDFGAVVLATGAREARDLGIPGRSLRGVHFAMDFLTQQNRKVAGDTLDPNEEIVAKGKHVVVLGGGDTGSDCVGTSIRQGAASVTQVELMPKPPLVRMPTNPWPEWPVVLRTSSSQEEGCERDWAVMTKAFVDGGAGAVAKLTAVRVQMSGGTLKEMAGPPVEIPCDLALLAMGFVGPEKDGLSAQFGVALDARGNIASDAAGATNVPGVFCAGDVTRGQSLVVWAIEGGRRVAASVDRFLVTADNVGTAA